MAFSLRDYTNKMRTMNAFECWPFELKEELTREKINSMLPPMKIPNDSGLVSQTDVLGSQSPQHNDKRNLNKTIPDANTAASASREKLSSRSKLRGRSIAEIFNCKKDDEKPPSSMPLVVMPMPPPMLETPNYALMTPPPPQPTKALQPSSPSFQIGNLLNIIVLEDDEEEDEQMVSKFRRSKQTLEAPRSKLESLNKIFTVAPGTNIAGDDDGEMENEVEDKVNIKESTALKEDAAKLKLQNPVINAPEEKVVYNFLKSCAKQEKSKQQLVKKSIAGPDEIHFHVQVPSKFEKVFYGDDEGTANLKANTNDENLYINVHKRKEACPIVEKKGFSNALGEVAVQRFLKSCAKQEKSKQPLKKSKLIQFHKGETRTLHFSPNVEVSRPHFAFQEGRISSMHTQVCKSESFRPSSADRNANSRNNDIEHNFNGLSLDSNGTLLNFSSGEKVEMNHRRNRTPQNRSLSVSRNVISNFPEQLIARTNPQGIISRPTLSNGKMNDRKRNHHGTSSALGVPFSPNLQGNTREVELGTSVGARRSNYCYHNEAQNLHPRIHLEFDSLDLNGVAKQSQNVDQDSSRCIPSSVPIAATTDSERDLEQQRKLTKHINI